MKLKTAKNEYDILRKKLVWEGDFDKKIIIKSRMKEIENNFTIAELVGEQYATAILNNRS